MRIGVIDSGMGGLAITRLIKSSLDQYIVVLDRAFFPYGTKTKEFLLKRSYYLVNFLVHQKVDFIILACNTLSIVALDFLKYCFQVKIIGVFNYFLPYLNSKNAIIGSLYTVEYVKKKYDIYVIDGTKIIEAIEKNKDYKSLIQQLDYNGKNKLILACTHFLSIPKKSFQIETIDQIEDLKNEIKKARNIPSKQKNLQS